MSELNATANRPNHPFQAAELTQTLQDTESFGILIEATPWADVHRAWTLAAGSLRYADIVYVAAAERHGTALLTADARIERSGAARRRVGVSRSAVLKWHRAGLITPELITPGNHLRWDAERVREQLRARRQRDE